MGPPVSSTIEAKYVHLRVRKRSSRSLFVCGMVQGAMFNPGRLAGRQHTRTPVQVTCKDAADPMIPYYEPSEA